MSLKKLISLTTALAACFSIPLHASESGLPSDESNSQRQQTTEKRIRADGNNEMRAASQAMLHAITNDVENCFRDYATKYLSGEFSWQDETPRISRKELHDLLVDYISCRYSKTPIIDNVDKLVSDVVSSEFFRINAQDISLDKFVDCAAQCITNAFNKHLIDNRKKLEKRGVKHFDLNHKEKGLNYIYIIVQQDSANYYIKKNLTSRDHNKARYLAAKLMDGYFSDFVISKMFVNGLQLDCDGGFYSPGTTRRPFMQRSDGPGHPRSLNVPVTFKVRQDSFDRVFESCLTDLTGETVVKGPFYNKLKQRTEETANKVSAKKLDSGHPQNILTVAALLDSSSDITMESLDSIFVAGITDKKATSEQVDSLVEEMAQSLSQASKEATALDLVYSTLEAPAERKIETPEQLLASAQKMGLLQDSDYEISGDYAFDASEEDKSMTPEQRSSLDEEMAF